MPDCVSAAKAAPLPSPPVAVFDLGGTWFRRGLYDPCSGALGHVERHPAISLRSNPGCTVEELQLRLVDYLVREIERMRPLSDRPIERAGVSVGAAVNAHNGRVLGSGPLWGSQRRTFDLRHVLRRRQPGIDWQVVNDVTAALLRVARDAEEEGEDLALITVSTGIAARWLNGPDGSIEVDPVCGIQGEIGHVPVSFVFRGVRHHLTCDCGGADHLNAFASGRGLEKVVATILGELRLPLPAAGSLGALTTDLLEEVLLAVTEPLAQIILTMIATKPRLRRVYLTGGVVHGLHGGAYVEALRSNLTRSKAYLISDSRPWLFEELIQLGPDDDASGLLGAGIAALESVRTSALG